MSTFPDPDSKNPENLIFQYFATLATAPEGIARLRELILQLAVQGNLGTQDPNDEPVSLLFAKIKKEREKLIKEGRAKPEKSLEPINHDNTSYDIPKEWRLTKFGDIIQRISNGYSGTQIKGSSGIPLTRIETISYGYIDRTRLGIVQEVSDNDIQYYKLEEGDILFSHINSDKHLGKTAVFREPDLILHGTNLLLIRLFKKQISFEYVDLFLKYLRSIGYFISIAQHAIHQSSINQTKVKEIVIAIPPLAEQHRIVAKVDRLMALCDELEARQQQERAGCLKLGTASLAGLQNTDSLEELAQRWAQVCDAFDLILDCSENVAVLRQTILQLAVQGRLVRQEPGDEPAKKLVERIRREKERLVKEGKIRVDKVSEPVDGDETPFTIPEGWLWVRLGSVLIKVQDGVHNSPVNVANGDFMYVTAKNIKPDGIQLSNVTYISAKEHEECYKRCNAEFGDVLLIKDGATTGIATINNLHQPFSMLSSVALLKPPKEIINKYLLYVLRSPFFYTFLREDMSGCAITRVTLIKLNRFIIPLPPLAEQHRIVAKVDALMALCDELEARLKERARVQERLAGAVVKGIVA